METPLPTQDMVNFGRKEEILSRPLRRGCGCVLPGRFAPTGPIPWENGKCPKSS